MITDHQRWQLEWLRIGTRTTPNASDAYNYATPEDYADAKLAAGDPLPAAPTAADRARLRVVLDKGPSLQALRDALDELVPP